MFTIDGALSVVASPIVYSAKLVEGRIALETHHTDRGRGLEASRHDAEAQRLQLRVHRTAGPAWLRIGSDQ